MAMILCPECGKAVSEFAQPCPKCGVTLTAESVQQQKQDMRQNKIFTFAVFGVLFLVLTVIVLMRGSDKKQGSSRSLTTPSASTAPRTALGTPSRSRQKHIEDAKTFLLKDGRSAVRRGLMTKREFESYTGVEY